MYEALLIRPEYMKNRRIIRCTFCDLKYKKKEYDVLLKAKKLAYFEFTSFEKTKPIVCHDCLHKYLCQLSDNPKEKILHIKDRKKILNCRVSCDKVGDLGDWNFE